MQFGDVEGEVFCKHEVNGLLALHDGVGAELHRAELCTREAAHHHQLEGRHQLNVLAGRVGPYVYVHQEVAVRGDPPHGLRAVRASKGPRQDPCWVVVPHRIAHQVPHGGPVCGGIGWVSAHSHNLAIQDAAPGESGGGIVRKRPKIQAGGGGRCVGHKRPLDILQRGQEAGLIARDGLGEAVARQHCLQWIDNAVVAGAADFDSLGHVEDQLLGAGGSHGYVHVYLVLDARPQDGRELSDILGPVKVHRLDFLDKPCGRRCSWGALRHHVERKQVGYGAGQVVASGVAGEDVQEGLVVEDSATQPGPVRFAIRREGIPRLDNLREALTAQDGLARDGDGGDEGARLSGREVHSIQSRGRVPPHEKRRCRGIVPNLRPRPRDQRDAILDLRNELAGVHPVVAVAVTGLHKEHRRLAHPHGLGNTGPESSEVPKKVGTRSELKLHLLGVADASEAVGCANGVALAHGHPDVVHAYAVHGKVR
mmetsp:Transcript_28236/g.47350  ORF Transcript_28236/g.47350 Transcript_28236/m.47350 type:complete len:481 (-) Transcript_28236:623-2065(-)